MTRSVFITPRDEKVKQAISDTREYSSLDKSLIGYQEYKGLSHLEIVSDQLEAIYNYLKNQGVSYINTPISFFHGAQSIKYPGEVLTTKSGNCIDLTCLFASMIEVLSMRPVIIIVPGHAFVGVYLWSDNDNICAVETTMIGTDNFTDACVEGGKLAEESNPDTGKMIDITACRTAGILPVSN